MSYDQAHADTLKELAAERALADDLFHALTEGTPAERQEALARYREARQ